MEEMQRNMNIEATLEEITMNLEPGHTLILDVTDDNHEQNDFIFDSLVTRGYNVKRIYTEGVCQLVITNE